MKRQIIKTRPVAPYRFARIAIAVIVVALLGALAYVLIWDRPHQSHAASASRPAAALRTAALQDSSIFLRNTQSPASLLI